MGHCHGATVTMPMQEYENLKHDADKARKIPAVALQRDLMNLVGFLMPSFIDGVDGEYTGNKQEVYEGINDSLLKYGLKLEKREGPVRHKYRIVEVQPDTIY